MRQSSHAFYDPVENIQKHKCLVKKTDAFPDVKQLKDVLLALPGLFGRTLIILLEIGSFYTDD